MDSNAWGSELCKWAPAKVSCALVEVLQCHLIISHWKNFKVLEKYNILLQLLMFGMEAKD